MIRRLLAGIALAVVAATAAATLAAAPAAAHAVVVSSSPGDREVLPTPPLEVQIQFSEGVSAELGGLTVLDSEGQRVDNNDSRVVGGDLLQASVQPDLPDGTYVMNYRVISTDGHPITGSIVFGVGASTSIDTDSVSGLRAGNERGYEIAAGVGRFVTYVAALLAAGLGIFVNFVHDQRADGFQLRRAVRLSAVVGGVGAVATVALQAAIVSGEGVSAMTDASTLRQALTEGLDWATVLVLLGLAAVHLSADVERLMARQALSFYGGLAVVGSFTFWGHTSSSEPRWLAIGGDVVHTAAAAVWFGGLVGLAAVIGGRARAARTEQLEPVPEPELVAVGAAGEPPSVDPVTPEPDDPRDVAASTARIIGRFSTIAAASVLALVAAGVALTWVEVRSIDALGSTTYGRVLLAKIAVVLVVLGAAAYNRYRLVPEIETDADDPEVETSRLWSKLTSSAWLEVGLILVVLALTSALVNITPARTSSTTGGVFDETQPVGDGQVQLVITPGLVGTNTMHIQYMDTSNRPLDMAQELTVEMRQEAAGVEPTTIEVPKAAPGHFLVDDAIFPIGGTWQITLIARVSDFEEERTTFTPDIGT